MCSSVSFLLHKLRYFLKLFLNQMDTHMFANSMDDISIQRSSQLASSFKDLKNLKEQLYSAAEYFESSYVNEKHKHFLVEGSKDYVARALVHTVDHLGSVADELNKFLDEKVNEFSDTNIRYSSIQQRLSTYQGFLNLRGLSKQSMIKHHKKYNIPDADNVTSAKSKFLPKNCSPCPEYDKHQPEQNITFDKAFQASKSEHKSSVLRKGQSRITSVENSPISKIFSYRRVMSDKESGRCSVSPLRLLLRRSGTIQYRSMSPSPSDEEHKRPLDPRRAVSVCCRSEMRNRERDIESYVKKSGHMFKAFLNIHRSRKES
ncbi:protein ABIL2-like [Primulina tabacum]|uniref:protein ABIL2-like n=1 Tax=Primulina tabacum TaxID=48773 RepID=UPI003F5AD509